METFLGLLGAFIGAAIFVCGYVLGKNTKEDEEIGTYEATEEEMREIREERERLIEDQKAFRELMNYNADMAYGITANPLKDKDKK